MPISFACSCGKRFNVKDELAGKQAKCPTCGTVLTVPQSSPSVLKAPVEEWWESDAAAAEPKPEAVRLPGPPAAMRRPAPRPPVPVERLDRSAARDGSEADHHLTAFPVGLVLLFNVLTLGIFGTIRVNLMHGRLPKVRPNDPSAGKAIGFLFIPFFNLYWLFFTYLRLAERLNEQRNLYGLPRAPLRGLALAFCIGMLVVGAIVMVFFPPGLYINPWSLILGTLFFTVVQGAVNELVELKALGAAPREEAKACPQCAEWVRTEAKACRYCGHVFQEGDAAATRERAAVDAEERAGLVRRAVLRNKRNLRLAWGWTLVGCGGLLLSLVLFGALVGPPPKESPSKKTVKPSPTTETDRDINEGRPDDKPSTKEMDLQSFLIGMSCTTAMILVFFLLPGFYLLYRAWRLGQELALLEAGASEPLATG